MSFQTMDRVRKNVFALMRNPADINPYIYLFTHLIDDDEGTVTLADGRVMTGRDLLLEIVSRFPNAAHMAIVLTRTMRHADVVTINGQEMNRLQVYGRALSHAIGRGGEAALYNALSVHMAPADTIVVRGNVMTRYDILSEFVTLGHATFGQYSRLAISMRPHDQVLVGEQMMDRLMLARIASDYSRQENDSVAEATLAMVVLNPRLPEDIQTLEQLLSQPREVFRVNVLHEPSGVNYNQLSIGGEDEREALIMATRSNDLYEFARSALARRRAELDRMQREFMRNLDRPPKRRNSSGGSKAKRRKSRGW